MPVDLNSLNWNKENENNWHRGSHHGSGTLLQKSQNENQLLPIYNNGFKSFPLKEKQGVNFENSFPAPKPSENKNVNRVLFPLMAQQTNIDADEHGYKKLRTIICQGIQDDSSAFDFMEELLSLCSWWSEREDGYGPGRR